MTKLEQINARGANSLPGLLGFKVLSVDGVTLVAEMPVTQKHFAPNGFLHAASIIALADTACGYACFANLPEGAQGFTTIELKSNFLGTARDGFIECSTVALHLGKTTQVWDATVKHRETGKTIAMFRCTQMVLWPK
jgi:1,4-dihydroxy-2-naphthoyl-CoA hydrolase